MILPATDNSVGERVVRRIRSNRLTVRNVGFGIALAATVLLLVTSLNSPIDLGDLSVPVPMLSILIALSLLLLAAHLNDYLMGTRGITCLKILLLAGSLGSFLLLFDSLVLFGAIATSLFVATSILVWGSSLSYYERTELLLTTAVSFFVTGILLIFALSVDDSLRLLLSSFLAVASAALIFVGRVNPIQQQSMISKNVSRSRTLSGKGNRSTIISVGMSVGAVISMGYYLPHDSTVLAFTMGGIVALASLTTALLRARLKIIFEDFARRSIAVAATFSILSYPFVPSSFQVVCVAVLLISVTINAIILIDAIAETARLKQISPLWIIGNEASLFMMGNLFALIVFWLCLNGPSEAMVVLCITLAIAFVALQVFVEEQTYPYFDNLSIESFDEYSEGAERLDNLFAGGGGKWRTRIDEVAAEYRLSPRQQEILRLLLKGRDVRYIMNKFVISQATAKTHVYNLYKKLDVHSRRELLDLLEERKETPGNQT